MMCDVRSAWAWTRGTHWTWGGKVPPKTFGDDTSSVHGYLHLAHLMFLAGTDIEASQWQVVDTHSCQCFVMSPHTEGVQTQNFCLCTLSNSQSPHNFTSTLNEPRAFPYGFKGRVLEIFMKGKRVRRSWRQKSCAGKKLPGLPPRWRSICS